MRWIVVPALLFVAVCIAVFGAPVCATLLAVAALLASRARWRWWIRSPLLVVALMGASAAALAEYPGRIDALRAKVDAGGPSALSTRDLGGLWLLNVGMAGGGALAGFPEVAAETLLLAVPGGETRTFRSAFPMGTTQVQAVVEEYEQRLARASGDRVELPARRLVFSYTGGHGEWRRGLALNPFVLRAVAHREGEGWRVDFTGTVPVDYPASARLELVDLGVWRLVIDEGLYDALEQRGWLHPYEAHWKWTLHLPSSDVDEPLTRRR